MWLALLAAVGGAELGNSSTVATAERKIEKHVDWYIGHPWDWRTPNNETPFNESYATSLDFALTTDRDLVDGLFVMTMHLNCGGVSGFLPSDA